MSTITSLQALDFERRLNALETNVGITIVARKRNANANANVNTNENNNYANNTNNKFESIDDRLAKIKLDLERKIAKAASEATTGTSTVSTTSSIGNNINDINVNSVNSNNNQRQQSQQSWKEIQKLLRELDPGIALTHQQQPLLYKRQQVLAVSDELANDFSELDVILKLLMSGTRVDGAAAAEAEGGGNDTNAGGAHTSHPKLFPKGQASSSSSSSPQKSKQQQQQQQAKKDLEKKLKKQQQQQQQQQNNSDATTTHRSSGTTLRLDQVLQAPILVPAPTAQQRSAQKRVADLQQTLVALNGRTKALQATLQHFLECYHVATMAVSEKIILADENITAAMAANAK